MTNSANVVVLGGKSKFGAFFSDYLEKLGHSVLAVGRPELDFRGGWVPVLRDLIVDRFEDVGNVDVIVVNVFDRHVDYLHVQQTVVQTIWSLYQSSSRLHVVVIGSMEHYYLNSFASKAKAGLRDYVLKTVETQANGAKLLLVEPYLLTPTPTGKSMSYKKLATSIVSLMALKTELLVTSIKHL